MPRTVTCHTLSELATGSSKGEIILETLINTQLHINAREGVTIIDLPYGNKFDIVDGRIIIYEKNFKTT